MAAINVIAVPSPASAQPDVTLSIEVAKYPTPVFGCGWRNSTKGRLPITWTSRVLPKIKETWDGGQASQTFEIRPRNRPATASAVYDVEQDGRHLGTFRVDFRLGSGDNPNDLEVTCDEQDSPVHCWAWQDPFIVRIYPKEPGLNN